jgi:predicted transcriptional regulator of viral defense system
VSRYMEIRDKLGVTDDRMGSLLDRELHAGRIERVSRGHYRRVV